MGILTLICLKIQNRHISGKLFNKLSSGDKWQHFWQISALYFILYLILDWHMFANVSVMCSNVFCQMSIKVR